MKLSYMSWRLLNVNLGHWFGFVRACNPRSRKPLEIFLLIVAVEILFEFDLLDLFQIFYVGLDIILSVPQIHGLVAIQSHFAPGIFTLASPCIDHCLEFEGRE